MAESPQESEHFHGRRNLADPDVRTRFQFISMPLHTKTGMFHEIRREESCNGLHNPGMRLGVPIAGPQFDYLLFLANIHRDPWSAFRCSECTVTSPWSI